MTSRREQRRLKRAERIAAGEPVPAWGGARPTAGRKPQPKKAAPPAVTVPAQPKAPGGIDINSMMRALPAILEASEKHSRKKRRTPETSPFVLPDFPKAALPPAGQRMAMDSNLDWAASSWGGAGFGLVTEGLVFPGYAYLSELAQRAEYRIISETIADDATRKWIDFEITGTEKEVEDRKAQDEENPDGATERREKRVKDNGKTERVKALKDYLVQLDAQAKFYALCRDDGFFGRTHLFLRIGAAEPSDAELATPIGNGRSEASRAKVTKDNPLTGLKVIEPVWTYPMTYNANNPLSNEWYNPQVWYVMGKQIHVSRILPFIGKPVPDLLKPAYSFGGLSNSQIAQPYVDMWIQTKQSVNELIHSFSVMVLMTDLQTLLQPGNAAGLIARAALFNTLRDNQNLMITNKGTEDFKNVSASLSGLDALQAQAQEHVASIVRIPLVKFTGLQPKGLNASAEGEIAVYDDTIGSYQNRFIRPGLTTVINFAQLSLWGEVDPEITFVFEKLRELSQKEQAEKKKAEAEIDEKYVNLGAIAPEEVRQRIIDDPELPYADLNPDDIPEPPDTQGLNEPGAKQPDNDNGGGAPQPKKEGGGAEDEEIPFLAADSLEWNEADHDRDEGGKFSAGGGGGKSKPAPKQKITAPQFGMPHGSFTAKGGDPAAASPAFTFGSTSKKSSNIGRELDPSSLTKVGAQKGSNPGGVYEDADGKKFYVKEGKSKDHVRNEMIAAALYGLAGTPTLKYRPTPDGTHIATEIEKLSKDNASKLSKAEKAEAARDLAVHAWLANWDAVGLGGDNLGTIGGVPTPLDLGGALDYRAQGSPKGKAFGTKVTELDTLRDKAINADAAGVFGNMTPADMRESARFVTGIPDAKIRDTVEKLGGSEALADKLIARKEDIAARARRFGEEGEPDKASSTVVIPAGEKPPVKELNGIPFKAWRPPTDWAAVDGQADIDEPEFEVPTGKKPASGVIIREPDGRVWIVQPKGGYGGYEATFPKGRAEEGLSLQANAIKEAYEESGLKVRITGHAGDHAGDLTYTRYYTAERESGDPSQHDDETEGVVLVPEKKASKFLNRKRDRTVLGLDEAPFNEGDHPRGPDGKFVKGAGSGYAGIKSPLITLGSTAKLTYEKTFNKAMHAPAVAGSNYRRLLSELIKEAKEYGSEHFVPELKQKLIESLGKSAANTMAKGDITGAKKLAAKMKELGATTEQIAVHVVGEKPAGPKPAPAPKPTPAPEPAKPAPAPAPVTKATPQELEKAKKAVKLQLQYVPGAPQTPAAQKLVDGFNAKYGEKPVTTPAGLEQKVADFKKLQADMIPLMSAEQKAQAEANAAKAKAEAEAKAKAQAAAAKSAAEAAKKAAADAKRNAEKNAAVMVELGISEKEAEGFNALVKMLGGSTVDAVESFKGYEAKAKKYGYPITGFQSALISNYSNGGYAAVNAKLRSGAWTPAQHVYVKMVNKALAQMPAYTGTLTRNTSLTSEQLKKYLEVGHIIQEEAFMSTSTGDVFSGNVQFKVTGIGKRGASIKKLSNHASENEVLFQARTFFKVDKVDKSGGSYVIHMTEWED